MSAIHQFVAGFTRGDAISNEALVLQRIFRSWGFDSEIFCERRRTLPELRRVARDIHQCSGKIAPDDVVFLHFSIGSEANTLFADIACRRALLYHNVTPAHYIDTVNKRMAADLAAGREQLAAVAGVADVRLADSSFNAAELEAMGYPDVAVLPLVLDLDELRAPADATVLKEFDDDTTNVLFVGRCAPNKKIEDTINTFAYFNRCVQPRSRFIHVGSYAGTERYYYLLQTHARELELDCVHFAGAVTQSQLIAFYRCADVFLCMSEHEGFCIPLLESMLHNVPVLAFAAGAIEETLDGAGVLFREKRHELLAEMLGRLTSDATFRTSVLARQAERLSRYIARDLSEELREHLRTLLA